MGSGYKHPHILNTGIRLKVVVGFTRWPTYPRRKKPFILLDWMRVAQESTWRSRNIFQLSEIIPRYLSSGA
jgi:hypothetical protein